MYLYLIRHAQSENNARPEHERVEDPPLTELGVRQAERLAESLRELRVERLYTSAFRRTLATAAVVAAHCDWPVEIDRDLHERGGCYRGWGESAVEGGPGMTPEEIAREFPNFQLDPRIGAYGWWASRPRETEQQAVARARLKLEEVAGKHPNGKRIAWMIHAEFKRCLLSLIVGGHWRQIHFGPIENTAVTKLHFDGERWRIAFFNDARHLPEHL